MKILWKYLRPNKGLIILALLLALAAQLLNLIDPIIFGRIIDDYASDRHNLTER
jgi:ATP-binding cassette, subfamily B, bacterial